MTPEGIRIISHLRSEFFSLFATAMQVPVSITNSNSYASNPTIASWMDNRRKLNYLCVYAHTAPDELVPKRPFILRVAANKGAGIATNTKREKDCQGLNQSWYFKITLLPEEVLDFLPWIVGLIKSYDKKSASFVLEPPHPLDYRIPGIAPFHDTWTQQARQQVLHPGVEKEILDLC